ncbi:MAG TPA: YicC/YloC family endoribonuclease [Gammaproteobacteria bacterium]
MIRSMTSFARCEQRLEAGTLCWELRSVNHRYLEVSPRLPEEFRPLEGALRELAARRLGRGKLECQLRFLPAAAGAQELVVDQALAGRVVAAAEAIAALIAQPAAIDPLDVLGWPGVRVMPEVDLQPVLEAAQALFGRALDELQETRAREGQRLAQLLVERCDAMAAIAVEVRARLPEVLERLRQRLADRLAELRAELNQERLEQEMALLANKLDVAEELDRLDAHLAEVRAVLRRKEPVGRRLDFLMQELHREANTLGSKSADVSTTRASVDLKVLIEQMREQVQNIE